jgi:hypothetical protein
MRANWCVDSGPMRPSGRQRPTFELRYSVELSLVKLFIHSIFCPADVPKQYGTEYPYEPERARGANVTGRHVQKYYIRIIRAGLNRFVEFLKPYIHVGCSYTPIRQPRHNDPYTRARCC